MNVAIVAAAGRGTRMGGGRAKQFLELAGVPVIFHTLKQFEKATEIQQVSVVIPSEDAAAFIEAAGAYGLRKLAHIVKGGPVRAQSVWRGLQSFNAASTEIVAVHDGVRPFVTAEEINATVAAARKTGAAILAAPVTDTIKATQDGFVSSTLDRSRLYRALTPQCFQYEILKQAFESRPALDESITDESMLVEALGHSVAIVRGSARNIKLTEPEDLVLGEHFLRTFQNS